MEAVRTPLPTIELHVPDFAPVRDFYGRLEFVVCRDEPWEGKAGYLTMALESNVVAFWCGNEAVYQHSYFGQFPPAVPRGVGVELVIQVLQLREYYERVRSRVVVADALRLRPWGLEDFRCIDPFGYYLRITSVHTVGRGAQSAGNS